MRILTLAVSLLALCGACASARAEDAPLAPLDFLQGCWRGQFAGASGVSDVHCFAPMLGGRYVRDTHAVVGAPTPYRGETIYAFDAEAHRIVYAYYASDGGSSHGYVEPVADGLSFPQDRYVGDDGAVLNLRSRWVRDGADHYTAITEAEQGGAWREAMRIVFVRAPELSSPP